MINEKVYSVLVTTGNQHALSKDKTVDQLADGQFGLFDNDTHLSLDATNTAASESMYLAVGGDKIKFSANPDEGILKKGFTGYKEQPATAGLPQIFDIGGYTAECDTEYLLKFGFVNEYIYNNYGFGEYSKTYGIKTSCCDNCTTSCPSGDCNEITELLINAINNDEDGLATAKAIEATDGTVKVTHDATHTGNLVFVVDGVNVNVAVTTGDLIAAVAIKIKNAFSGSTAFSGYTVTVATDTVTIAKDSTGGVAFTFTYVTAQGVTATVVAPTIADIADLDIWAAANPDKCSGIRVTTVPTSINTFCAIPTKYNKYQQTRINASFVEGFDCNGEFLEVQDMVLSSGDGSRVKLLEYNQTGEGGSPYKMDMIPGMPRDYAYQADESLKYNLFTLLYKSTSNLQWSELPDWSETIVAIPTGGALTRTDLKALLDLI